MILITGANGHLGSQTIGFLQNMSPEVNIAGLVRREQKGVENLLGRKPAGLDTFIKQFFES